MKFVSIVIPTYNRARKVSYAIDSVLNQTYKISELIIVDDGSTDETTKILEKYRSLPNVIYIKHPRNKGVNAAKNTGLKTISSDCDYFGTLDSDDTLLPDAVERLINVHLSHNGSLSQVFGWCSDMNTGERTGKYPGDSGYITLDLALSGQFSGEFWQLINYSIAKGRYFDENGRGGEGILWNQLLRIAPAFLISDFVRIYDRSGHDRVSNITYDEETCLQRANNYIKFLDEFFVELKSKYPNQYANLSFEAAKYALMGGKRRIAGRYALRSLTAKLRVNKFIFLLFLLLPVIFFKSFVKFLHRT